MNHNDTLKKILFLSTVDSHIYYFHLPFMNYLKNKNYSVEVAAFNTGFKNKIEEKGYKFYDIPFSKNPLSFRNFISFFLLIKLFNKNKYILVHTHTPIASFIGRVASKICNIPNIVYTAHGFHFHEYGNKIKNFIYIYLEKFAGRFTDILITINDYDYNMALKYKIVPQDKLFYIKGVGLDIEFFNPDLITDDLKRYYKTSLNISENEFVLINISEFRKEKNLFDLLEVLYKLKKSNYKFKCLLIGDGSLKNKLTKKIKELNLENNILLLGIREDIRELTSISDIYITTSIREGLSKSIMEAMSMEKPIISYNIRGIRELIEDGNNGFLVPFKNIDNFVEKVEYFIKNVKDREIFGKKAREKIQKEFSIDEILSQMEKIYNKLLP